VDARASSVSAWRRPCSRYSRHRQHHLLAKYQTDVSMQYSAEQQDRELHAQTVAKHPNVAVTLVVRSGTYSSCRSCGWGDFYRKA